MKVYDSDRRRSAFVEELEAAWQGRGLVSALVYRDLVARYKRSALGVVWTLLNPLATMAVIALVFSYVFDRMESYHVYLLSGLVPYMFFSDATGKASRNLLWAGGLLKRIYLPKGTLILSTVISSTVNFMFMMVALLLIAWVSGKGFSIQLVCLPIAVVLTAMLALGVGLTVCTVTTFYPDFAELYTVFLRLLFYMTPILWPLGMLPKNVEQLVIWSNPLASIVQIFHACLYYETWPAPSLFVHATATSVLFLLIGWAVFSYNADRFSYRL